MTEKKGCTSGYTIGDVTLPCQWPWPSNEEHEWLGHYHTVEKDGKRLEVVWKDIDAKCPDHIQARTDFVVKLAQAQLSSPKS